MDSIEIINGLSQSQVIESALSFCEFLEADKNEEIINLINDNPSKYIKEIEDLSRIILINACDNPSYAEIVREIINSSGKKNFIVTELTIISIGMFAIATLKIIFPDTEIEEFKDENGNLVKRTIKITSNVDFLTSFFKSKS